MQEGVKNNGKGKYVRKTKLTVYKNNSNVQGLDIYTQVQIFTYIFN